VTGDPESAAPLGPILGLDVGRTRIGVAISDPEGRIAVPMDTLQAGSPADLDAIASIAAEHAVTEVVVGLPLHMSGARGPEAEEAESFAARLALLLGLPVHLQDERLSTVEAHRSLAAAGSTSRARRTVVDRSAAAVILQAYLDRRRGTGPYP
jgi:putative holliday junction resolvase